MKIKASGGAKRKNFCGLQKLCPFCPFRYRDLTITGNGGLTEPPAEGIAFRKSPRHQQGAPPEETDT